MADSNEILNLIEQYQQAGGDGATLLSGIHTLYSTDKTSLGLNQWVLTDKPRMEDFNQDNRIIDEKLVELQAKTDVRTGTWIPHIYGETTVGNPVYTQRWGTFDTVCGLTVCRGTIALSSKGGMEGGLAIGGLPAVNSGSVSTPSCNIGGIILASGQIFTGFVLFENFARLRYQNNTTSIWMTADMIKDNFAANYFTFIYTSA